MDNISKRTIQSLYLKVKTLYSTEEGQKGSQMMYYPNVINVDLVAIISQTVKIQGVIYCLFNATSVVQAKVLHVAPIVKM